jgi:hypothetical protein
MKDFRMVQTMEQQRVHLRGSSMAWKLGAERALPMAVMVVEKKAQSAAGQRVRWLALHLVQRMVGLMFLVSNR